MTSNSKKNDPFDTVAKAKVRLIDNQYIRNFKAKHFPDKPLSYLGLPGPNLLDILSLREYIDHWTGVQSIDTPELAADADDLEVCVMLNKLERDFLFLKGNIDDFILSESSEAQLLRWPYQLINLDYIGGLVHATHDLTSKHIDAIKKITVKQTREPFTLLLTMNLRDKDAGEMTNTVQNLKEELLSARCNNVEERFEQHQSYKNAGLQKIYVPTIIENHANEHIVHFNPPILYQGSKQMMHFVIEFLPYKHLASGKSNVLATRVSSVNLPLIVIDGEGNIKQEDFGSPISFNED